MRFTKVHGLGNDFLIADLRGVAATTQPSPIDPEIARKLCDRRFGVGADGVLGILDPTSPAAHARMTIRNADGSEPEMCGNGIRCVAKWLYDRGMRHPILSIDTAAGRLDCAIQTGSDGLAETVAVEMGRPSVAALDRALEVQGSTFTVTEISIGNPHAVIFVDDPSSLRLLAERVGPTIEHHPRYPARTNVEFASITNGRIHLVVWERGCGITLACGTGASATAAAAVATGRLPQGCEVEVYLPGGSLFIRVHADLAGVVMRGPCVEIFEADIDLKHL